LEQVILGQDFLVISVLTVAEFFAYQIDRAKLDDAEEMVAQMQLAPNISILPVSLEIASA
jgi:hypothetical protein